MQEVSGSIPLCSTISLSIWKRPNVGSFFIAICKQIIEERTIMIEGIELAKACAVAADENKAENILVRDLRGLSSITDFVVICSGTSMPHLKAILRNIGDVLIVNHKVKPLRSEGLSGSRWVILDYVDVMVHIMLEDMRDLYALEDLWADAESVEWEA